jgi:MFS family permease
MDDSGVFIVFTTLYILQAAIYPVTGRACGRFGEDRVAVSALWLRAVGLLAALATVLLMLRNSTLMIGSIMSIAMIGTAFAFFNTSSSVLLFRTLPHGKQGELLGIYSAMTGIAAFAGAIMSGYLSYSFGYAITFVAAALLYVSCALALRSAVGEHYQPS